MNEAIDKYMDLYNFRCLYLKCLLTTEEIFKKLYIPHYKDTYINMRKVIKEFRIETPNNKFSNNNNNLISIALYFNISPIMLFIRLITNINIIDAIKLGIQERDSKGLTYGMLGKLHERDSEYTTKGIIDRIIKDKIKEEKENNNNG